MKIDARLAGTALLTALMLAACSRSEPAVTGNAVAPAPANQIASAAPAPAPAQPAPAQPAPAAPADKTPAADVFGDVGEPAPQSEQGPHEDRSGATRRASCNINDEGRKPCTFTPVLGDGSFDIDNDDHSLRLVVSDGEGALFDRVGERRIPLPGVYERDQADRACWYSDDPDAMVSRICAY